LAEPTPWQLQVVESRLLTPNFQRVVLTAPGLEDLRCVAGQDLMLRVPRTEGTVTNRRYTIRRFDPTRPAVTIDVALHGAGPGIRWIRGARAGDRIDGLGPRGKITLQDGADWHLFIADDTGVPGALAMVEALPANSTVKALLEVDTPDDQQEPISKHELQAELHWIHRVERSVPGDASLLMEALNEMELPTGAGHAYVAAEAGVVRDIQLLLTERGLSLDQISAKAYWRRGLPNADHGEPVRH
jgi:NADPH-dependent ferric siderophore reductase